MNTNFLGSVLPTDSFAQMAFVEILNTILTSDDIVDANRMSIGRNVDPISGSLSGHFRWSYVNDHLTLWQCVEYNSPICFRQCIFSIHFGMLANRDRKGNNMIVN